MRPLILIAALLSGCAPVMKCHDVGNVEVCEGRRCRDWATGKFVKCPAEAR